MIVSGGEDLASKKIIFGLRLAIDGDWGEISKSITILFILQM